MLKTARVTPRNIQFADNVQIKEIPTDVFESYTSVKRLSWDPNLNGTEVFKQKPTKQRNVIIVIIICAAVLLAIIIGTICGVVLSQKTTSAAAESLTYNEVCKTGSDQCKSSQGLYCPNGFCSCGSPYSWNQITKTCTLLTYNQTCLASNQCNSSLGLNCTNQICQCDNYHSWNSLNNTCLIILNNTLNYGDKCAVGSSQCNSSVELTCIGNCTCKNSKIWDISTCVCPSGTFLNSSNLCEPAYKNNVSCVIGSNQCDSAKNLSCNTNTSLCQCDSNKYWNTNSEICSLRLNYSELCSLDSDCVPTLICPILPSVCNCPQYLSAHVCNCPNEKYYNSTIFQCVNRATFNGTCIPSANYTCLSSLYCNAGICACPLGTNWIVANSTCA